MYAIKLTRKIYSFQKKVDGSCFGNQTVVTTCRVPLHLLRKGIIVTKNFTTVYYNVQ